MKKNRDSKVIIGYSTNNRIPSTDTIFTISYSKKINKFIVHNTASKTSYFLPLSEVKDFLKEIENE